MIQTEHDVLPAPLHFYNTGKHKWKLATKEALAKMLRTSPPEYISILGFGQPYDPDHEADTKYIGPMYFDLDGPSDEVIPQFQKLLRKLEGMGVNLDQVRFYSSGKKGFHIELPSPLFMPLMPPEGIKDLPRIYKEMAMNLFVDLVDLSVYSGRQGRLWRVSNRKRDNGAFKVPITAAEAFSMTPETYCQLCSAPRLWRPLHPPELNSELALLFLTCQSKVGVASASQTKAIKIDAELNRRFSGQFPQCLKYLMDGKVQSPKGFNLVALQLAATARALGLVEDEFIKQCAGLIQSHQSDGGRYNTTAKREAELRTQYKSSNYPASVGGMRSILPRGFPAREFAGMGVQQ